MSSPTPTLTQFRLELQPNGLAHLVFDCPNRTMNVFSEAAIHEIGLVAAWLPNADVAGLLIRSGKETAFCAGADLTELGVAYDMIMRAPLRDRFNVAFEHFFRLSRNLRALETAGKPVAAAIAGLALGGGCELALATHYRVLVDDPNVGMGLPESLVGLLPGAGGTQRLPRLIGVEHALPVLLDGVRLAGQAALDAGLVQALAPRGDEVAVAEAWLLANPHAQQPWDCDGFDPRSASAGLPLVDAARHKALQETLGHYPAPLAILDCVAFGLPQCFEGAIRSEMSIFAYLIQRLEARNMIQTMFLGKTDYERVARKGAVPAGVAAVVAAVENTLASSSIAPDMLAAIGFAGRGKVAPLRDRALPSFWVETADPVARQGLELLDALSAVATPLAEGLNEAERRMADYGVVKATGYPAYLGGPLAFGAYRTA